MRPAYRFAGAASDTPTETRYSNPFGGRIRLKYPRTGHWASKIRYDDHGELIFDIGGPQGATNQQRKPVHWGYDLIFGDNLTDVIVGFLVTLFV